MNLKNIFNEPVALIALAGSCAALASVFAKMAFSDFFESTLAQSYLVRTSILAHLFNRKSIN
jgi:hypothetical protein